MFWVRIRLGGREYLGVLDTCATISIVARKILPCGSLKNTMTTAAIRMGDGHVVHSCGDCEVEVPMGSRTIAHRFYVMDTEAFDFVLGTDFFVQHSQIQSLTLQAPYLLYVDHGTGRESVPLEQSEHTSSYLRLSKEEPSNMMAASKTEDNQLLGEVLDQGLKEFGYSREDLSVELFASDKQHVLDLYCSKGKNCSYKFYWPSFGMAYGNPRFSELGKVLTKVALERSRMVLCSPDWGAHGGNEYWRNLLDRLTISSVRLPDEAIYVPLGRKTPIGKPGWGSMLSVVDGGLTSIPWEDLDPTLVQAIQRESDGLALGDLKDRLRPQDAVEATPGGDEYVVTDTNQGTSRRSRNRPFDAVLLRRDGGNREAPPGGWAAPEDHERVLRSVIRAAWPDREPTWPAFLEGGAVLHITDADANNWLPRALRSALAHWRYRRHNPPPPQPQPPHKRRRK